MGVPAASPAPQCCTDFVVCREVAEKNLIFYTQPVLLAGSFWHYLFLFLGCISLKSIVSHLISTFTREAEVSALAVTVQILS